MLSPGSGNPKAEVEEMSKLGKKVADLKEENEMLKKAANLHLTVGLKRKWSVWLQVIGRTREAAGLVVHSIR